MQMILTLPTTRFIAPQIHKSSLDENTKSTNLSFRRSNSSYVNIFGPPPTITSYRCRTIRCYRIGKDPCRDGPVSIYEVISAAKLGRRGLENLGIENVKIRLALSLNFSLICVLKIESLRGYLGPAELSAKRTKCQVPGTHRTALPSPVGSSVQGTANADKLMNRSGGACLHTITNDIGCGKNAPVWCSVKQRQ